MKTDFKVGDEVYLFSENARVYTKAAPGEKWTGSKIIFRGYFVKYKIVGETSRSWLIGCEWKPTKYPKNRKVENPHWWAGRFYTQEEVDEACWLETNRQALADTVKFCLDIAKLKEVAEIVGFEELPEPRRD
jgi:hypothetical protein